MFNKVLENKIVKYNKLNLWYTIKAKIVEIFLLKIIWPHSLDKGRFKKDMWFQIVISINIIVKKNGTL